VFSNYQNLLKIVTRNEKENADKLFVKMSELANSVESVANAQKEAAITTQSNDIVLNSQLVIDQKLDKILAALSNLESKTNSNHNSAELSVLVNQTLQKLKPEEKLVKQELLDANKLKIEKLEKQIQSEIELRKKVEEELLLENMVKDRIVNELREEQINRLALEEELVAEKKARIKAEEDYFAEFEKRNKLAQQLISMEHEVSLSSLTASWRKVEP